LSRGLHDVDPLGPANPLIFATGPLTGTGAPTSARHSVSARSPLTGTVFDGNSGGAFGVVFKRLGYDYLWVDGALAAPGYLLIGRDAVEVREAADLWGLDVPTTLARLRERHPGSEAAVIGPAGENQVLFASIVNNRGRSVGRGGLGAVMGAKLLKAIVVSAGGDLQPSPVDQERFAFVVYEAGKMLKSNPVTSQALPEFGTAVLVNVLNQAGAFPTRNFRESQFEHAEQISGEALRKGFTRKRSACRGCSIGCARRTMTARESGEGPEYETIWALGADCGVADLSLILEASYACNRLGLDTITTGATIACAMELTQEGLLPSGPRFGDGAAVAPLVASIGAREGLGAELALGSRRLAERCGAPELAMQVKGLELPAYDPRGMKGQGLAFATSNRGGCHLRANMLNPEILGIPKMIDRFATLGKAGLLINLQNLSAVLDSLSLCKFTAFAMKEDYYARLLSAMTGETVEPQELLRIGERIWNAERLFNLAAGFGRADDMLPPRLLREPVAGGPSKGEVVDLEPMLDEYYISRGWDGEGRPSEGKLRSLGLPSPDLHSPDLPSPDLHSRLAPGADVRRATAAAPRPHGPDRATAGRRPGGSVENDESAAATA
ncbi:MAG: aldehyde ferredoxin oxidoreductase family protein, partial [Thermoleophilia bacterium]